MAIYNLTFTENLTSPVDIITGITSLTGGSYIVGHFILLIVFLIFLAFSREDLNRVLIVDGFITTILAIIFFIMGMVPATTIIYPALVIMIGLVIFFFSK